MIHETAIVSQNAKLDPSVSVGPYSIIHDNVTIGPETIIESHVIIKKNTIIGKNNHFYQFSSIGEQPQDLKFKGEDSSLIIGDNNIFREYCTLNRGTKDGINKTIIGSDNLFMAYSHIAHDCIIKNHCIFSNAASLAGHVVVGDYVSLGGFSLVHQFCNIGNFAFSGLGTVISQDVSPYTLVAGNHAKAYKINTEGLKRKGFDKDVISALEKLFKLFIKSKKTREEAIDIYNKLNFSYDETKYFFDFIQNSSRGITR